MDRVKFPRREQRKFLNSIRERLNCPSIRGILQFHPEIKYSSLKNYYTERRLMPKNIFEDLCHLANLNPSLKIKYLNPNWGQIKGGKLGKRTKF